MSEGGVMSEDCHEGCLKAEHFAGRYLNESSFLNLGKKKPVLNTGKEIVCQWHYHVGTNMHAHRLLLISFILHLEGMQSRVGRKQQVS